MLTRRVRFWQHERGLNCPLYFSLRGFSASKTNPCPRNRHPQRPHAVPQCYTYTADLTSYYWMQHPNHSHVRVLRFWSPSIPAWHMKTRGKPKALGWGLWLTCPFPRVSGLGETSSSSPLTKRKDSSPLVCLQTHLHTHTPQNTHTHPIHTLKPLACSVTSTLHLFTA